MRRQYLRPIWLPLSVGIISGFAVTVFATRNAISQVWNEQIGCNQPYSGSTFVDLMAERNRIEVYDFRRQPALIQTLTITGQKRLNLTYICRPGEETDAFELGYKAGNQDRKLLSLASVPSTGVFLST